jgi:hypothetical protein
MDDQNVEHEPCTCRAHHPAPTPSRRWSRLLGMAAIVVGVGVASSLTTVWASHDFPDVPNDNPHHDDISWLADNNITTGFGDGNFRPTNPVARQQMASFLRRMSAEFEVVTDNGTAGNSTTWAGSAACPAGKRAIAGGGAMNNSNAVMFASYPSADTWYVGWRATTGTLNGNDFDVWALCAPGL